MFTGIIKEVGIVTRIVTNIEGIRIYVQSKNLIENMQVDESISIDGVCQTIIGVEDDIFEVQCVHTTLEKTTFNQFKIGSKVNLELPLKFNQPIDGHLVQGHVNGVGIVDSIREIGENIEVTFEVGVELSRYMIEEGSVAINGISLTIAKIERDEKRFVVSIIPHTRRVTNFSTLKRGVRVNIEVDMFAKYIEKFLFLREKSLR